MTDESVTKFRHLSDWFFLALGAGMATGYTVHAVTTPDLFSAVWAVAFAVISFDSWIRVSRRVE